MPQVLFAKYMMGKKEKPTLLNYGWLDVGLYTAAGIYPENKFFCAIPQVKNEEMDDEQSRSVENGAVDFVITITPVDFARYHLVMERTLFNIKGDDLSYYLYEKNDLQ